MIPRRNRTSFCLRSANICLSNPYIAVIGDSFFTNYAKAICSTRLF